MGWFRSRIRRLLRWACGYDIARITATSYTLVDQREKSAAWFSYEAQLRTIFEENDIDLVVDAGANRGQFAQPLRCFYSGDILSFEPVSGVFRRLAAAASTDPDWQVYRYALGSRDGVQTIHIADSSDFSSLLTTNEYCRKQFGKRVRNTTEEKVSVRRLDGILEEIFPRLEGRRIFLKIDTQGYDTEVFRGLGGILKQVVAMQTELSFIPIYEEAPHWTESISIFEEAGFSVSSIFPITRDALRMIECDCLFLRDS